MIPQSGITTSSRYRQPLEEGRGSLLSRLFGSYCTASKDLQSVLKIELPRTPHARLALLEDIQDGLTKRKAFEEATQYLKPLFGDVWREDTTPFTDIRECWNWFTEHNEEIASFTPEQLQYLVTSDVVLSFNELKDVTVEASRKVGLETPELAAEELTRARDELNDLTTLLHSSVPERDYTPFEVISELSSLIGSGASTITFDASALEVISRADLDTLRKELSRYLKNYEYSDLGKGNPYFGAKNLDLQPTELWRLTKDLEEAKVAIETWIEYQRFIKLPISDSSEHSLMAADRAGSVYRALGAAPEGASKYVKMLHRQMTRGSGRLIEAIDTGADWLEHKARLEPMTSSIRSGTRALPNTVGR